MKREVLNYLVRAFEARMQSERISELKFDFPDCWQEIIASEALIPRGAAQDRLIRVDYDDEDSDGYRQVYREKDEFVYYYNGRHVVSDDDMRMYAFRPDWFPRWLSTSLKLTEPTSLLDDRLWCLGELQGVTVLLARGLRQNLDEVLDAVESQALSSSLLISRNLPSTRRLELPLGCQLIELSDVLPTKGPVRVDYHHFLSYIDPLQARLEREGVLWDEVNGILRVVGHEPWVLKGAPERCQLITKLYQAGKCGRSPKLHTQLLLENVRSSNLTQFFGSDKRWPEFIGYEPGASGHCWLKHFVEFKETSVTA